MRWCGILYGFNANQKYIKNINDIGIKYCALAILTDVSPIIILMLLLLAQLQQSYSKKGK